MLLAGLAMYGVGTKTALITSGFGVILLFCLFLNFINLGLVPVLDSTIQPTS
jgi:hypothetical protein